MINASGFIPTLTHDQVKNHGVQIFSLSAIAQSWPANIPHREENYQFILQKEGRFKLMLDFRPIEMKGASLFFILPGQIHHHIFSDADAYVLIADPSFIQETYKTILDQYFLSHDPVPIKPKKLKKLGYCVAFLSDEVEHASTDICKRHIIRGLTDAVLGMFAEEYSRPAQYDGKKEARNAVITRQFKTLLFSHYKTMKKPSDYALIIKVSTPYLNEAVKTYSGFTVSYWIQKMIITEAKRLLYYTDRTVKEIAYELGYDDHAYFSRLFTLAEKVAPVGYRKKYR